MKLEKMDDFFAARVDGYDEHMRTNIEGASGFYAYTSSNADLNAMLETVAGDLNPVVPTLTAAEPYPSDHLKACGKTNHREMLALQEHVVKTKTAVQNHPAAKARQESIIDRAVSALKDLFIRAISYDPIALMKERKAVRADIELKGTEAIEKAIGKKHSFRIYLQSKEKADEIVDGVEREQKEQKPRGKEKPLQLFEVTRKIKKTKEMQ